MSSPSLTDRDRRVRHVDFDISEWISETYDLSPEELGLYTRLWLLIARHGGPVRRDDFREDARCDKRVCDRVLDRLIDRKRIIALDDRLDIPRCEVELERARKRIDTARENGAKSRGTSVKNYHKSEPVFSGNNDLENPVGPLYTRESQGETKEPELGFEKPKGESRRSAPAPDGAQSHTRPASSEDDGPGVSPSANSVRAGIRDPPCGDDNPNPPTEEQKAEVSALVSQATAALQGQKTRVFDPVAYGAGIEARRWQLWLAGARMDGGLLRFVSENIPAGEALWAAQAAIQEALEAGSRDALNLRNPVAMREIDRLDRVYRKKKEWVAQAAEAAAPAREKRRNWSRAYSDRKDDIYASAADGSEGEAA